MKMEVESKFNVGDRVHIDIYYEVNVVDIKFNDGFMDAMIVEEELYQCDIVSGEPIVERLNPRKVHVFKNGYSNKIDI